MNAPLNHFLGAVMLLTRAPVGRFYRHAPDGTLAHTVVYFPLVGLLVGIAGGLAGWAATLIFPVPLAVLICMLASVVITGGFHEDGLADAADGLFGGCTPARRLEIMKDSRIGTYGAVALWFTLTAKFLLLQELLRHASGAWFVGMLAAAHTFGRGATVLLLQALPYVSGAQSKARRFAERLSRRQIAFALLLPVAVAVVLPARCGPACLLTAILVAVGAGRWFRDKIGGVTGDCLGATNQLVELACYGVGVVQLLHPFSGSLSLAASVPVSITGGLRSGSLTPNRRVRPGVDYRLAVWRASSQRPYGTHFSFNAHQGLKSLATIQGLKSLATINCPSGAKTTPGSTAPASPNSEPRTSNSTAPPG
jgi:adenosylcobinamide-GDP ribazoletransferase